MAQCVQYDNNYSNNIKKLSTDISFVKAIINSNNSMTEGVWYPIVIYKKENEAVDCDLLHKRKDSIAEIDKNYLNIYGVDKCQSKNIEYFDILTIEDSAAIQKSRFFDGANVEYGYNPLNCSYCGTHSRTWRLIDEQGNISDAYQADCCGGACDVRMNEDDYIPKIPLLNHHYYTDPCDFKYIGDNPARSGPGLGKEAVIKSSDIEDLNFNGDVSFCVDWKLKETISEIPYDDDTTQHPSQVLHNKAYKKSQITSFTCGNFILTSVNQENEFSGYDYDWLHDNLADLPDVADFTKPYGIKGSTTDNIFVGKNKAGSFWKWNYTSGILGWYRKYDYSRLDDQRPISGYDLYISPGDVFYATNAQIEPNPTTEEAEEDPPFIKACPSGLKIVQNSNFIGIIPNESSFMYISANIYDLFYEWYERYLEAGHSFETSRELAAIMSTAPQFENVTTDLLDPVLAASGSSAYSLNSLQQIQELSKDMQTGTDFKTKNIHYINSDIDLLNVLQLKYGSYLSIENNSSIEFSKPVDNNFVLDLNFDVVVTKRSTPDYSQTITVGAKKLLEASGKTLNVNGIKYETKDSYRLYDIYPRIVDSENFDGEYCNDCDAYSSFYLTDNGEAACIEDGDASFCYDTLAFFLNNSQGEEEGTRPQRRISDATIRDSRPVNFYHHYVDTFAINSKNSMYVSSAMHDVPIGITSVSSSSCPRGQSLSLKFDITGAKIKLYWSTLKQVQNRQCISNERFPLDLDNLCKCNTNS